MDGGDKITGAVGLERVKEGVFPVRQLVLVKEIGRDSCPHWCCFDWYGENKNQSILQGYDIGVNSPGL